MSNENEAYRLLTLRMLDAVGEFVETFPEYEPQPPELEGVSIREMTGGPYDGLYEVRGLCKTCNQVVGHMVHPDASGDEVHRAFHCNCRTTRTEGYRIPRFTSSKLSGPSFVVDDMRAEPLGFADPLAPYRNGGRV
jgi:hypothetical protein